MALMDTATMGQHEDSLLQLCDKKMDWLQFFLDLSHIHIIRIGFL